MKQKYKFLSKNILLFALSSILPKAISFVMVPLYTNCLSTGDYGIGDIIMTAAQLAMPIFTLTIYSGVLRFGFDKEYSKDDVLSCGMWITLRGFIICSILATAIYIIQPFEFTLVNYISFLMFFISNSLYEVYTNYARTVDKVNVIVELSVIHTFLACCFNVLFLLVFDWGLTGYLLANYMGTLLAVVYGTFRMKTWKHIGRKYMKKETVRAMQKYSAPLVMNRIGWWISNSSDRYIVTWMLGAAANGVYSVAYKIPTILSAFSDVFANAWQLSAIKEFDKDDKDNFVTNMYSLYNSFLAICCSVLIIFSVPLASLLYQKEFFYAWHYVPFLLASFMFNGLAAFLGSIFVAVKDSKIISLSTLIAAGVNIILNIVLIWIFHDAVGAAIATAISYIVVWLVRLIHLRKYITLHLNKAILISNYVLIAVQTGVCQLGFTVLSVSIQTGILILLIIVNRTYLLGVLQTFKKIIKKRGAK